MYTGAGVTLLSNVRSGSRYTSSVILSCTCGMSENNHAGHMYISVKKAEDLTIAGDDGFVRKRQVPYKWIDVMIIVFLLTSSS